MGAGWVHCIDRRCGNRDGNHHLGDVAMTLQIAFFQPPAAKSSLSRTAQADSSSLPSQYLQSACRASARSFPPFAPQQPLLNPLIWRSMPWKGSIGHSCREAPMNVLIR
jgi:hypothetical protein